MRIWAVCVVTFFGAAELYQWVQGLTLPLPIYGVAGLLLAVASNADRLPWPQPRQSLHVDPSQSANAPSLLSPSAVTPPISAQPAERKTPQLPNLQKTAAPPAISFTIGSSRSSQS